ncbi:hypothetical protein HK102_001935 [Quaeritorhiza haematococci]|nr:hypothetical protein HK102_001935 [Quaeritorhiza haematococci]
MRARPSMHVFNVCQKLSKVELVLLGMVSALLLICTFETIWPIPPPLSISTTNSQLKRGSPPALTADAGSPPQLYRNAYASLSVGDGVLYGTLVLFHSLRQVDARADFVALVYNISQQAYDKLHSFGIRTYAVEPISFENTYINWEEGKHMSSRDEILWSKLRVWQLEDYDKVVLLDADLFALQNADELFEMPEFSACPMADRKEKIQFWASAEYGLRLHSKITKNLISNLPGWSGLNSGVTVLAPSNATFSSLINELGILPNRPCCPSQEFLLHYFEERGKFFRLPMVYNGRLAKDMEDAERESLTRHLKLYHFVGEKPWKARTNKNKLHRLWWQYKDEIDAILDSD